MALRTTGYIVLLAFGANIGLLVSNVVRYLIPLKIKSMLLTLFYIIALVMNVARSFELIYYVLPSNGNPSLTGEVKIGLGQSIADSIASVANVAMGCLFVATMYQISYSIKMIDNSMMKFEKAARRKCIVYTLAALTALIFTVLQLVGFLCWENREKIGYFEMVVFYSFLAVVYIWTMCHLRKSFEGLKGSNLETEKQSVLLQFFLFLLSYLTRIAFIIPEMIFHEN